MIPVLDPSLVPPTWLMPSATASSSGNGGSISSGSPSKYHHHDGRRRSHHAHADASSSSSRAVAAQSQNQNHRGNVVGAGAKPSTSQETNLLSQRRKKKKKQLIHKDSDVILKDDDEDLVDADADDAREDGHKFDDNDTDSTMEETNYHSDNSGGSARDTDATTTTTIHQRHHDNHHHHRHENHHHRRHRPQHHHDLPTSSSSYGHSANSHNNYNDNRHVNDRTSDDEYHQRNNKKNYSLPNFLQWNSREDYHHTNTTIVSHHYHTADESINSNFVGGGRRRNCDLSKNKDYNNNNNDNKNREMNGYHYDDDSFNSEDICDGDDEDTKKWRSSFYINLKTMGHRRRWLLGAWFFSCVIISNLLWQARYQESVLESFDIDSSLFYSWLGLPVLKPIEVCFVTAQYTSSVDKKDNLVNLKQESPQLFNKRLSKYFHYFAFTNQKILIDASSNGDHRNENDDSDDNGWTVVVHPMYNFKRFITQSRWPKFQGHKHEMLQQANCQVVFYMDGTVLPRGTVYQFQAEARRILNSDVGLSQEVHPLGGGVSGEMERCRLKSKDVEENLNATWTWLNEQPDFVDQCTLYQNTFFGYSVKSKSWTQASDFAWDRFSLEVDSWRDQPLWCYTLHHFHTKPLIISRVLFEYQGKRRGKGKHTYGKEAATAAHDFLHKKETPAPRSRAERAQDEKEHQESLLVKALKRRRTPRVSSAVDGDKETKEERIERQRQRIEMARKRNALRQSAAG